MKAVTIRKIPDDVHRALKTRAARHGRSTEAEMRAILAEAVQPEKRVKLGTLLGEISRRYGGVELGELRDKTPSDPVSFD